MAAHLSHEVGAPPSTIILSNTNRDNAFRTLYQRRIGPSVERQHHCADNEEEEKTVANLELDSVCVKKINGAQCSPSNN